MSRHSSGDAGFTLTEVLVAMGLLAIGMAGILSLFSAAVTLQREATERMDVALLLPGVMGEVRADLERLVREKRNWSLSDLNRRELPVPADPRYRYRVTFAEDPSAGSGNVFLCRVELLARRRGEARTYDFGYLPIVIDESNDARIRDLMGR